MILPCTCENAPQDSIYGKGNRVHNKCKSDAGTAKYRCTVCSKMTTISGRQEKAKGE